jgi:hypothetical protein
MSEPAVVAAGGGSVRRYLAELGMPEDEVSRYLQQARKGPGPALFSFGADSAGAPSRYWLSCDASEFVLVRHEPQTR